MFSLILIVISIALVVTLVTATLYHGGDVASKGRNEAQIAESINDLQLINGAIKAYNANEGRQPADIEALVPEYLRSIPNNWGADTSGAVSFGSARLLTGTAEAKLANCLEINTRLGNPNPAPPLCSAMDVGFQGCCESPP